MHCSLVSDKKTDDLGLLLESVNITKSTALMDKSDSLI